MNQWKKFIHPVYKTDSTNRLIEAGDTVTFILHDGSEQDETVAAVSDDGRPVMNPQVMRHAMEYARDHGLVVVDHCQDLHLSAGGVMNEGRYSTLLGLKGISHAAEESHVSRDIMLAELTGARVHIAHISTKGAVELVREAKRRGLPVTCEVTPHHLALTDADVVGFDTNTKMNPPLRSEEDRAALIEAVGAAGAIADHEYEVVFVQGHEQFEAAVL